jgi:diguanylate cyclase
MGEGMRMAWTGSPCAVMLGGGPSFTPDLASQFPDHPLVRDGGATALATVPLRTADGKVFGTLCAADRSGHAMAKSSVVLLDLFARLLVEHLGEPQKALAPAAAPGLWGA